MIPIYRAGNIQIDITNACHIKCANCTRFVGHHKKPYFMDIEMVVKAIDSLDGFAGTVGIMGGEPALHPDFFKICELFQEMIPDKRRRQLWTAGYKWEDYKDIIYETFDKDLIIYNDHSDPNEGVHQPLLIAADDIIEDKAFMWRLIGNCWVQWRWSPVITPRGAFFCEVAGALDLLFSGPGGYAIEKNWWNKDPWEFQDQVKRYCPMCSAAIPMPRPSSHRESDMVSISNAKRLKESGSPKYLNEKLEIFDKKITEDDIEKVVKQGWTPWSHRSYKQCAPDIKWKGCDIQK